VVFALTFAPLAAIALYAKASGYRVWWLLIPVGALIVGSLGYALFQPWLRRWFGSRRH
jgi:hypothetical protein